MARRSRNAGRSRFVLSSRCYRGPNMRPTEARLRMAPIVRTAAESEVFARVLAAGGPRLDVIQFQPFTRAAASPLVRYESTLAPVPQVHLSRHGRSDVTTANRRSGGHRTACAGRRSLLARPSSNSKALLLQFPFVRLEPPLHQGQQIP